MTLTEKGKVELSYLQRFLQTGDYKNLKQYRPVRTTKIGRNDSCPCGSGKKYKKCCGR